MLLLLVSALLSWHALASPLDDTYYSIDRTEEYFQSFMQEYNKQYRDQDEMQQRLEIFRDNLVEINQINKQRSKRVHGITKFSDLTKDEFRTMYRGFDSNLKGSSCQMGNDGSLQNIQSPDSFDWRDKNVVSPVKDQIDCGSCWTYSTTGNVESQYAIKHGQVIELSEQQLLDCDTQSAGCRGGSYETALGLLISEGAEGEADYPYTAKQGTCQYSASLVKANVTGCTLYQFTSEDSVKDLLYQNGPISIAIQASALQHFPGGIIDPQICNVGDVDHAVLLVGYGTDGSTPYWIIKNSWDTNWGENGFFRIQRNVNTCRMLDSPMATCTVA